MTIFVTNIVWKKPVAKRKTLMVDQNKLIIKVCEKKVKQTDIAKLFSVNRSTVCCIIRLCESRCNIQNRPQNRRAGMMSEITRHVLVK